MERQRLDKLVADNAMVSRKQARERIRDGRVRVNGEPVLTGEHKVGPEDAVTLDGAALRNREHLYIMMNKPAGVLSATRDSKAPTALELLPENLRRKNLFPAGRLDKDTEGFLLITDDGAFAHHILAPTKHVPKIYHVELAGGPVDLQMIIAKLEEGLVLDGGDRCSPAQVSFLQNGGALTARLTIYEGMYHQVKRMFTQFSLSVTYLKRIGIGGLFLDERLFPGQAREILHKELKKISPDFDRFMVQKT